MISFLAAIDALSLLFGSWTLVHNTVPITLLVFDLAADYVTGTYPCLSYPNRYT